MILPRRNLKQLLQQKVAHMERNVPWKKLATLRKKWTLLYWKGLHSAYTWKMIG